MTAFVKPSHIVLFLVAPMCVFSSCKDENSPDETTTGSESYSVTDTASHTETGSLSASDTDTGSASDSVTGDTVGTDETETPTDTETRTESESQTVDTETYETDPDAVTLRGPCPIESRLGGFAVSLYEKSSTVNGAVANGIVPVNVPDHIAQAGDCVLLKRRNLACNPPCNPDQTCDQDLSCIPVPYNQDLGTVILRGLAKYLALNPVMPGSKYFDTKLPHPAAKPGDVVQLETKTGYMGAQEMYAIGVEPLTLTDAQWLVRNNHALTIHWTAPSDGERSRVIISFNIDQHGTSPMRIECDFADDGEGEVPVELITQMMEAGVTGYPSGTATRRTIDSVMIPDGCVDFAVTSPRVATVRVEGYTPCTTDADCPNNDCDEGVGLCRP